MTKQHRLLTNNCTAGQCRAEHLTDVIEATYTDLRATANPSHLVPSGWIAIPTETTLDESEAAKVFAAVGAWKQQKTASNASTLSSVRITTSST